MLSLNYICFFYKEFGGRKKKIDAIYNETCSRNAKSRRDLPQPQKILLKFNPSQLNCMLRFKRLRFNRTTNI